MSLESRLYEAHEVQMAHATTRFITRMVRAASEVSSLNLKYDVFLSFRGFDTRKKFTDHLNKALKDCGYRTFRDEDEIEPGENIKSELREAIRSSRMSVIVLSTNYSNSAACLFELQMILELQKTGHKILPVFYDVDPLEIKEQAQKLDFKNRTNEQVEAWSAALKEVAGMKGMVSQNQCNGYEAKLIEDIVEDICKKGMAIRNNEAVLQFLRLSRDYQYLCGQAEDIQSKVQSEMHQIWKKPMKTVVLWLTHVKSLEVDVQRLEQEVSGESRVRSPVELRKDIEEKIQEVAELLKRGRDFKDLLGPLPIDRVQCMPSIQEYLRETLPVMQYSV